MAQPKLFLVSLLASALFVTPLWAATKTVEPAADTLIVKRNYQAAFQQLLAQAKSGNAVAMFKLSSAYRYGLGTQRSLAEAQHWLEASAAAGNAKAKLALKRWPIDVQPTVKKKDDGALAENTTRRVDFSKLPPRPANAPAWVVMAAAQKDHAAVSALAENAPGPSLLVAASLGDAATLKTLASTTSTKDGQGRDAVMLAANSGKGDALDALLSAKPDLAVTDKAGQTAVSLAAASCDAATLAALATAGANLETPVAALPIIAQRCGDFTPLIPIFEKRDLNSVDGAGRTAAWFAAKRGDKALIEWLASHNADLSKPDALGFTPAHVAAASGQSEALQLLLAKNAKPAEKTLRGVTPLMLAAASGCTDCLAALLVTKPALDEKDADGDTALMFAVRSLQAKSAQILADSGANPNAKNNSGDAPGKLAVRVGMAAAPK